MKSEKNSYVYVASCVPDGGILRYRLDASGGFTFIDKLALPTPNYMVHRGDIMYVTLQTPFPDSDEGGVIGLRIGGDGALAVDGKVIPSGGTSTCHLAFEGEDIYLANYGSGSVTKVGNAPVCHSGRGVDPSRQEGPHCHCAFFSPDERYLLVCDLGLDTVFTYDRDLNEVSRAKVPDGEGCRHLAFSKDGGYVYVLNELGCSVSVFAYNDGRLLYRSTLPTRTYRTHEGPDKGSAIKLSRNGKYLFITNRGENEVVTIRVKGEKLRVVSRCDTEGNEPRDFSLLGEERFGLVTNQFSDSILLYRVSRWPFGRLRKILRLEIPAPLCVIGI